MFAFLFGMAEVPLVLTSILCGSVTTNVTLEKISTEKFCAILFMEGAATCDTTP